jgi:Bacterial Ig-like domain (group 3)
MKMTLIPQAAAAVLLLSATPSGTVTFKDETATLGTGTLNASAPAAFTTSTLSVGTHSIRAVYAGDANFTGSTSPVLSPGGELASPRRLRFL